MQNRFSSIPTVVKNLLLVNATFFIATFLVEKIFGYNLSFTLGLHYFKSTAFQPFQIITHMFMHADIMHIFFNMYALFLFGQILERVWGPKRFLIYYFVTGFGAALLHVLVNHFHIQSLINSMPTEYVDLVINEGAEIIKNNKNYVDENLGELNALFNGTTVGASGAVFGLLLAFGMLFPNTELFLMFIPIPIKAKYFVIGYGLFELIYGISNIQGDNVAHFAHLGGMLFGYILLKFWKTN